jgi:ribosomal protein S18 acetylase RimI-like enzyme
MSGKVIQGFFVGGRPRAVGGGPKLPAPVTQPKAMPRSPRPPAPVFAGRPPIAPAGLPGPPAPAFAARPPVAQPRASGDAFPIGPGQIDPAQIGLRSGGGRPLPDAVRGQMEAALGADFSSVRVHVGPQAERLGAIAFTLGTDIYFAPGRFQPDTIHGQQLLGHELAHVVQQRAGRVRNPLGAGIAVVQDWALEAEADRLGHLAAAHRVAARATSAPSAVQPSSPVRISPPVSTGPGTYRLTAGAGGPAVGSVMMHARDKVSVEITDLGVDPAHRAHGLGKRLLASAARTAQLSGRSKMTLAAQDNGSGRLTQWYKAMGFVQVGVTQRGCPRLEAPVSRVLAGTASAAFRPVVGGAQQSGGFAPAPAGRPRPLQRSVAAANGLVARPAMVQPGATNRRLLPTFPASVFPGSAFPASYAAFGPHASATGSDGARINRPGATLLKRIAGSGIVQRMKRARRADSDDDSDYEDPDEARNLRQAEKKRRKKDPDADYESSDDEDDRPAGYMEVSTYLDHHRVQVPRGLGAHGDVYYWVKPYGGRVAIYFKPSWVEETKQEKMTSNRAESTADEGDGLTWHHTDQCSRGLCLLQLVPRDIHAAVSHIGGVGLR